MLGVFLGSMGTRAMRRAQCFYTNLMSGNKDIVCHPKTRALFRELYTDAECRARLSTRVNQDLYSYYPAWYYVGHICARIPALQGMAELCWSCARSARLEIRL